MREPRCPRCTSRKKQWADNGEDVWRVVRVPPPEAEGERLLPRYLRKLERTRVQTTSRIQTALFQHGVASSPRKMGFDEREFLQQLRGVGDIGTYTLTPEVTSRKKWWQFWR